MKTVFALFVIFLFLNVHAQTSNKAGALDSSFGNGGKTVYTFPDNYAECYASALQADGKVIVAGEAGYGQPTGCFFLRRYNTNGIVDLSFGDSGNVLSNFGFSEQGIYALAITNDNKIVAAGFCNNLGLNICMARYLSNGNLDSSFGKNGVVNSDLGGWEWARGMVLQPDGKILITGRVSPIGDFVVVRYNENGSIDSSFGTNGKTLTDLGQDDQSGCIALQKDGKIIVGGYQVSIGGGFNNQFALARYTPQGILDESFGNNGIVLQNFTDYADVVNALAIQSDGKIIAAGQVNGSYDYQHEYMAAARFNTDGSLDESFGNNGLAKAVFPRFATYGNTVQIQNDNKILLGGFTYQSEGDISDFALARFLNDGTPDNLFGTNGQVTTDFGLRDEGVSLLLQPDEEIIMAGEDYTNQLPVIYNIAIARYNNDESKKQIIIAKIRRWLQHHNGIEWDNVNGISSYVVQRSYDGVHFNSIARIHAGNTSNYTYEDASPLNSTNYYRLQTTNTSGAVNYSNVIAVTNDNIKISPNPATNSLHIEGLSSNKAKLTVVDFSGNIKLQAVVNASSYNLNIALLKTGNYLLKIETNGEVVTKKFVKE